MFSTKSEPIQENKTGYSRASSSSDVKTHTYFLMYAVQYLRLSNSRQETDRYTDSIRSSVTDREHEGRHSDLTDETTNIDCYL